MEIVFFLFVLFLSVGTILLALFLASMFFDSIRMTVPYVPTRTNVLEKAVRVLDLREGSVLFDLGCGDGRLLLNAYSKYPEAKYVGVEKGILPFLRAKFLTRKTPIRILNQDIFKIDLTEATHIYCYLSESFNIELSRKIISECRPGTIVVSSDFKMPGLKFLSEFPIEGNKRDLNRVLYLYKKVGST